MLFFSFIFFWVSFPTPPTPSQLLGIAYLAPPYHKGVERVWLHFELRKIDSYPTVPTALQPFSTKAQWGSLGEGWERYMCSCLAPRVPAFQMHTS